VDRLEDDDRATHRRERQLSAAKSRGHVEDTDFEAVRAAGFTDAQIIDIVAETAVSRSRRRGTTKSTNARSLSGKRFCLSYIR
jgi:alkylhydroperoxidase family enzyme